MEKEWKEGRSRKKDRKEKKEGNKRLGKKMGGR